VGAREGLRKSQLSFGTGKACTRDKQEAGSTEDADDQDCMPRGTRAKISHV
jgi:hypothetical protein